MSVTHIYSLNCPNTGNPRYIGKADDPKERLRGHLKEKRATYKCNWIKSLIKNNQKPILEIIDTIPINEWQFWERHYISLYRSFGFKLTNKAFGGEGGDMPIEVKNKWKISRKGRLVGEYQRRRTSETMIGNKYAAGNTNNRKPIISFNTNTGTILYHDSSYHAAKDLGILDTSIRNNLHGLSQIVSKKYKFFYQ